MTEFGGVADTSVAGFRDWVRERGVVPPSVRTVRQAIAELTTKGLLIRLSRGSYRIPMRVEGSENGQNDSGQESQGSPDGAPGS